MVLAGADLDRDLLFHNSGWEKGVLPRLLWLTRPEFGGGRDEVLVLRKLARGAPALGNAGAQLRAEQFDALFSNRRLVFDTQAIPRNHLMIRYYDRARVDRLAQAAAHLRDPEKRESALLRDLQEVLTRRPTVATLTPYLASPETSVKLYALWRMEKLLCGGSGHLEDDYLVRVADLGRRRPRRLPEERRDSPCRTVREGYWPPADLIGDHEEHEAKASTKKKRAYTAARTPR